VAFFVGECLERLRGQHLRRFLFGIRAAELALQRFNSYDHMNLVAVVETDMCGVDAIQFLTGCTFGKGNLIHKDYGKIAYPCFMKAEQKL